METATITASVLHGPRDLRLEPRAISPPEPTEVQVSILATGLCGSDLHYYNHFSIGSIPVRTPLTLGHESIGVVTAAGSNVTHLRPGDRVALEVGQPCETPEDCIYCASGRYNICPGMRFRSSAKTFPHAQGTLQERLNHPARWAHLLPASVPLELGALVEPLAVALHARNRADLKPGCSVLVLGSGAVGQLCAAVSIAAGAANVVVADVRAERTEFAVKHGYAHGAVVVPNERPADIESSLEFAKKMAALVREKNSGKEVDVVFECSGAQTCTQAAIYATRPGGRVMMIGLGSDVQSLPASAAFCREVDLIGVYRYANTYPTAISLVSQAKEAGDGNGRPLPDLSPLITHRFTGLGSVEAAFAMAARVKDDDEKLVMKVIVDTSQSS